VQVKIAKPSASRLRHQRTAGSAQRARHQPGIHEMARADQSRADTSALRSRRNTSYAECLRSHQGSSRSRSATDIAVHLGGLHMMDECHDSDAVPIKLRGKADLPCGCVAPVAATVDRSPIHIERAVESGISTAMRRAVFSEVSSRKVDAWAGERRGPFPTAESRSSVNQRRRRARDFSGTREPQAEGPTRRARASVGDARASSVPQCTTANRS